MSLMKHPLFPELRPWLFKVCKSKESKKDRIYRVEVDRHIPPKLLGRARRIKVLCVRCGKKQHPIRRRMFTNSEGTRVYENRHYVAVACPLDVNCGCSRGERAKNEIAAIAVQLVEHVPHRRGSS